MPIVVLIPGGTNTVAPDAPATTAFLARTSGLSGTETAAYKALINGLVADGVFSLLDVLYIFATNTTTTANLNLVSTNFTATGGTPPSFTVDQGYTGNGTTQFLDTNYVPSSAGLNFQQDSASLGVYIRGGRTTNTNAIQLGVADPVPQFWSYLAVLSGASQVNIDLNGNTFPNGAIPANTANGFLSITRQGASAATALAIYKNASSTATDTPASISKGLPTVSLYIGASDQKGTGAVQFASDQISAAYIGGGITGAQHLLLSNRINAYMTALGINVYT